MNVNSSTDAAMATIFSESAKNDTGTAVLKKAIDIEEKNAKALINAIPQPAKSVDKLPPNLGRNINTTA